MTDSCLVPCSPLLCALVVTVAACAQGVDGAGFDLAIDAAVDALASPEAASAPPHALAPRPTSSAADLDASADAATAPPAAPAAPDAAPGDADVADASPGSRPSPGDLLITEVMFYPSGAEPQSEWFEVYNLTGSPKVLSGLTIQDGYPRTHTIGTSPVVVAPPYAYVVLVRSRSAAQTDLLPASSVVYEYGAGVLADQGIQLENGVGGAVSLWDGTTELADVPYGSWGAAVAPGETIEMSALRYTGSDTPSAWCVARYAWAIGADDGTPGAPGDCP